MADADSKRISHLQMEAIHFSFTDKIGSVVQKGIEAAQSMHRKDSLDELEFAKTSLHSQMEIVSKWDRNRDDSTRKQIYALCEILEIMIKDRIISSNSLFSNTDTEQEIINSPETRKNEKVHPNQDGNGMIMEPDFAQHPTQSPSIILASAPKEIYSLHPIEIVAQVSRKASAASDLKLEVADPNFDDIEIIVDGEVKQESLEEIFKEAIDSSMNENYFVEANQSPMTTLEATPLPLFARKSSEPMGQEEKYEKMENSDGDDDFLEIYCDSEDFAKNSDDSDENMGNDVNYTPNRSKIRRFPCKYCHDVQPNRKELLAHMTDQHAEKVRMHTCKVCGIFSASRTHHLQHIATHSNFEKGKRTYKCQACEKTFASLTTLSQHANSHSSDLLVRRPFKCDICEYRATQKQALQRHVKTHKR